MMNFEQQGIPLFRDADTMKSAGHVYWNYFRYPHLMLVGATGSGKSYAVMLLLGRVSTHVPDAKAIICDYKADDFRFLEGAPRYYNFDECTEGLNAAYESFLSRQRGEPSRSMRIFVMDEYASYINMLEKKEAEEAKRKLSTLLMLGRSFNFHVIISQQRADATYFNTARDNFNIVVALGNLSRESRDMFFANFKDEMIPVHKIGEGYVLTNGSFLQHIQVPHITDHTKLKNAVKRLVN